MINSRPINPREMRTRTIHDAEMLLNGAEYNEKGTLLFTEEQKNMARQQASNSLAQVAVDGADVSRWSLWDEAEVKNREPLEDEIARMEKVEEFRATIREITDPYEPLFFEKNTLQN